MAMDAEDRKYLVMASAIAFLLFALGWFGFGWAGVAIMYVFIGCALWLIVDELTISMWWKPIFFWMPALYWKWLREKLFFNDEN